MKKLLLILTVCIPVVIMAETQTLADLVIQMNTAQRDGDYLGALVAATAILKQDNNHRVAKNFVHNNYQRMDLQARDRISEIAFSEDAAELEEICEIYRKLMEINDNLTEVELPLHGGNKLTGEWDWQPEIQYYRGHYDKARTRVFDLYKRVAKAAVKESHFDAAYEYFTRALTNYLLSEEYKSQLKNIISTCSDMAEADAQSHKTDELVRGYNTYSLIVRLDSIQNVKPQQKKLQPLIADAYVRDAEKLLASDLVTDWELAYEYYQTALDWNTEPAFTSHINKESGALRRQIAKYYSDQNMPDQASKWSK